MRIQKLLAQNRKHLTGIFLATLIAGLFLLTHGPVEQIVAVNFHPTLMGNFLRDEIQTALLQVIEYRDRYGRRWSESEILYETPYPGGRIALEAKLFQQALAK